MKTLSVTLIEDVVSNVQTISALVELDNGEVETVVVRSTDGNWRIAAEAVAAANAGEISSDELGEKIFNAVNRVEVVREKITAVKGFVDGRMSLQGNSVLIDGDPIDPVLSAHVLRLLDADGTPRDIRNWKAFAKFIDNLYTNSSAFVREQLFGWLNYENLNGRGFTLTDDGCFIGYKGCAVGPDGDPVSINRGQAVADGVAYNGAIPNVVGTVVEMPRSSVQDDPQVGCSTGLHVGTYDYAKGFARGVIVTVKVNPRDVVSVPTECAAQKIRTCRYEVLETTEVAYTEPVWGDDEFDEDDYYDECFDCGYIDCVCDGGCDDIDEEEDVAWGEDESQDVSEDETPKSDEPVSVEQETVSDLLKDFVSQSLGIDVNAMAEHFGGMFAGDDDSDEEASVEDLASGPVTVGFDYRKGREVKHYEVELDEDSTLEDSDYLLHGNLTNGDGYRRFFKDRIVPGSFEIL